MIGQTIRTHLLPILSVILALTPATWACAQSYVSQNQDFSAEIVNLRRTASGQVLATVIFHSRTAMGTVLTINNNVDQCSEAAGLIDGLGSEYISQNCINHRGSSNNGPFSREGIRIDGPGDATFVFRFETPLPADESANQDINITIPIFYEVIRNGGVWNYERRVNNVSLSFYGLSIPYSAQR